MCLYPSSMAYMSLVLGYTGYTVTRLKTLYFSVARPVTARLRLVCRQQAEGKGNDLGDADTKAHNLVVIIGRARRTP